MKGSPSEQIFPLLASEVSYRQPVLSLRARAFEKLHDCLKSGNLESALTLFVSLKGNRSFVELLQEAETFARDSDLLDMPRVYIHKGDLDTAVKLFMEIMASGVYKDSIDYLAYGYALRVKRAPLDQVIRIFRIACQKDPESAEAHFYLGDAAVDAGHFELAEKALRHCEKIGGVYGKEYHALGNVYFAQNQWEQARVMYWKYITTTSLLGVREIDEYEELIIDAERKMNVCSVNIELG